MSPRQFVHPYEPEMCVFVVGVAVQEAYVRIDPATNRVVGAVALSHVIRPGGLAFGGGFVWVSVGGPIQR